MTRFLVFAALLACAPLAAEEIKVGDDVAEFMPENWINPPAFGSFEELRGDVILFFAWEKDVPEAVKQISTVNNLAKKPGLHVVGFYTGVHKFSDLESAISKNKVTWPVALDGAWKAGYESPEKPRFWVIGADGKVKFVGNSGYEKAVNAELAKVKHPGLGKDSIHKSLASAATQLGQDKYSQAYAAAQKAYDTLEDKDALDDADYIIKRIEGRVTSLVSRAEAAEAEKDYAIAIRLWEELVKYKGVEDAAEAADRLKKLNDSTDVKKELAARHDLIEIAYDRVGEWRATDKNNASAVKKYHEKWAAAYRKFAEKHAGTSAEETATALAEAYEQEAKG